jgi:hypothetical protein
MKMKITLTSYSAESNLILLSHMVITCTSFTHCIFKRFVHFFQLKAITSLKKNQLICICGGDGFMVDEVAL